MNGFGEDDVGFQMAPVVLGDVYGCEYTQYIRG